MIHQLEARRLFATLSVPGLSDGTFVSGLSNPTAMEFAPDGRVFVCQQGGALRVVKNGSLLATPFMSLSVDSAGERGLLGIAFDPNFASNRFIYVYYTVPAPAGGNAHNRVSRFTASAANPDVVQAGSELAIMDLEDLSTATNHNGGAIHFGTDGKLYVAVGENANGSNAQTLNNRLGKVLRINSDGTLPSDNPYFTDDNITQPRDYIWALGLRNPFTFAFKSDGTLYINDVGESTWEEINVGVAGANYGWPTIEGMRTTQTPPANYHDPLFAYRHPFTGSDPTMVGIAITGGTFYERPASVADKPATFPASANNDYFFSDLGSGTSGGNWIRRLDGSTANASLVATALNTPVDLNEGPDGALYYLERGNNGRIGRIANTVGSPTTPDLITDSGDNGTDNVTNTPNPTFNGFAAPGSTVQIFSDGALVGTGPAGVGGGLYSITTSPLTAGVHQITAVAMVSGNSSATTDALSITIDLTRPTAMFNPFEFQTAKRLSAVFSEDVAASLDAGDLIVQNLTTNTTLPASAFAVSTTGAPGTPTTGIWTATGELADGNYSAGLATGFAIRDVAGNPLDGNPTVSFFVLAGDANHDRAVNALDFNALASNFGMTSGATLSLGDFNGDGKVDSGDFAVLAMKFNNSLPALPAGPVNPVMQSVSGSLFADRKITPDDSILG